MSTIDHIRNFAIIAHIDHGKSKIADRIIQKCGGLSDREMKEQVLDSMDIERERGITIKAQTVRLNYKSRNGNKYILNIIDTPGHVDFTIEVERSLKVLDGAVCCFDGVAGVEPQSETVWRQADRYGVPRIAFVNKMDRTGADFFKVIEMIKDRLNANPVPIVLPIGSGDIFTGLIDLIKMEAILYTSEDGSSFEYGEIPADMAEAADKWRLHLLEEVASYDEHLMEKYLKDEPSLFAAATMVAGVNAQDGEGGSGTTGIGGVSGGVIASGVVVAGIVAGVVNNNSADAPGNGGTTPGQPTCEGDDQIVDGVCVGTTETVTVTTSGSVTKTITVPVTFTYAPTVQ